MENKIIVDGTDLNIHEFDWLMRQDLEFLHHWIASTIILEQTQEGGRITQRPERQVMAIYVLLHMLQRLKQAQPLLAEA